eukprot:1176273-Prorocentrum_minimum.AAC.2
MRVLLDKRGRLIGTGNARRHLQVALLQSVQTQESTPPVHRVGAGGVITLGATRSELIAYVYHHDVQADSKKSPNYTLDAAAIINKVVVALKPEAPNKKFEVAISYSFRISICTSHISDPIDFAAHMFRDVARPRSDARPDFRSVRAKRERGSPPGRRSPGGGSREGGRAT